MKAENVRRIDLRSMTTTGGVPGPSIIIQAGTGNADRLDGYDSSLNGTPYTIPVLDAYGQLPPSVFPTGADYVAGETGVRYIGPTTRLAAALAAGDVYIEVTERMYTLGTETLVLSRYGQEVEQVRVLSTAQDMGNGKWRYPVTRAINGTKAQAWAKGSSVIGLGAPDGDGYIVINSASISTDSTRGMLGKPPYIDMFENVSGLSEWRTRLGKLSSVPDAFKDLFTSVYEDTPINWDSFGLAAQNAFLSGGIYARYGSIAGNLDVTGNLTVYDVNTPARVSFGQTPGGFGMSLQDRNRKPIWTLAAAYLDEESGTYDSDTVWVVESQGDRVIWLRYDTTSANWALDIGPWTVRQYEFTSRATDPTNSNEPYCIMRPGQSYQFGHVVMWDTDTAGYRFSVNGNSDLYGDADIAGTLRHYGSRAGFFNVEPIGRPLVEGAKDSNAALASLVTALKNLGLITDNTAA